MDPYKAKREYAQLLRLHERLKTQLQVVRDLLKAPVTRDLLKGIRNRTGTPHDTRIEAVVTSVEEAIRGLKISEAGLRDELLEEPREAALKEVPNLPAVLARFLAEKGEHPGFAYEIQQDEVRGWVISWKEYTASGTVRGAGQFYERPYAWLDE